MTNYILRGVTQDGEVRYYTGRAGAGWLSTKLADAFTYENRDGARRKAGLHNRHTALHGLHFTAQEKPEGSYGSVTLKSGRQVEVWIPHKE